MHRVPLRIISLLMAVPLLAATQSFPGVTVLNHPGGGTIAYAQMPAQHTVQGAITRVMLYVEARFGAKPKVTHVLKSKDGNSLAVTFTLKATTESPGDVTGLALVAVTASGPGKGAVLSDQSDRFGSTVRDMLQQMRQVASGASATTAIASTAAPDPTPAATTSATATPAPMSAAPAPASKTAGSKAPTSPVGPLHTTALPDGSGSIGLPDGWNITAAHAGEVIAQGPAPAALHFDFQVSAYDPGQGPGQGRTAPRSSLQSDQGMHAVPYGADIATKLNLISEQNARWQHTSPPTVKVLDTQQVAANNYLVLADVNPADGATPIRAWTQILVGPLTSMGIYSMTLYQILLPQTTSNDQGNAAAKALFAGYQPNNQKIMAELAADKAGSDQAVAAIQRRTAENQANADILLAANRRAFDSQQRSFAADDYALLGNTVVRDRDFNEHGLVSDNLADALTQADPNRFQEVPPSQYVKGVDY
jgi:hypothetical protein